MTCNNYIAEVKFHPTPKTLDLIQKGYLNSIHLKLLKNVVVTQMPLIKIFSFHWFISFGEIEHGVVILLIPSDPPVIGTCTISSELCYYVYLTLVLSQLDMSLQDCWEQEKKKFNLITLTTDLCFGSIHFGVANGLSSAICVFENWEYNVYSFSFMMFYNRQPHFHLRICSVVINDDLLLLYSDVRWGNR